MQPRPGRIAIFEQFAADGITTMFGNPGTVEQGFLDAGNQRGFDYVLALQETVAVGMADGYARAAAGPALVQLHSGVGLGNGIGMLYQAKRGHSPLVVIAGSAGIRYDALDAQMAADLVGMARPVTKYATRVLHRDSVLRVLRRAVKTAMTPPRGPVFVELPMDVLDEPNTEPVLPSVLPTRSVVPVAAELDRAAAALRGASRPVILMGDGVAVANAQPQLAEIAAVLDADVYGVDSSELNIDNADPHYRGTTGHMFGDHSGQLVADADAVLIVGTYVFPDVFPTLGNPFRPDAKIVHVDLDDYEMAKNHPVDVALVADPAPTLAALADRLAAGRTAERRPGRPAAGRPTVRPDSPMIEHFAAALAEATTADRLVIFDEALTASPGLLRHLPPRTPGGYFATRGGSLGVGIPGAIGAKLARPESTVVGFTGDGGSMYTIQALWTAARYGVDAKFVVCDNRRYELLDQNIEQYWRERGIPEHPFPREFDLSHPRIGFAELAGSLSVEALRVEKPGEVQAAVHRMLAHDGPFLVDLVTG